jgi:hypothetical protein
MVILPSAYCSGTSRWFASKLCVGEAGLIMITLVTSLLTSIEYVCPYVISFGTPPIVGR